MPPPEAYRSETLHLQSADTKELHKHLRIHFKVELKQEKKKL